jgi:outer membrane protein OmpA-like peptidoglycan-associated protein
MSQRTYIPKPLKNRIPKQLKTRSPLVVGFIAAALLAGCTTTDPHTGEQKTSNTAKDAGIGAVAGAILGAAVSSKHDRAKGALAGAAIGGGIGAAVGHRADKQEAELRKKLENSGVEVERQGNTINLVVPNAISFATNSAQLTPNFYGPLNQVAESLKAYSDTSVQIVGHTDSTGSATYNQQLSVNRANAVVVYLSAQGVNPERMQAIGMGLSQPIADNKTVEGRAQNRRVEIKIIPHEGQESRDDRYDQEDREDRDSY